MISFIYSPWVMKNLKCKRKRLGKLYSLNLSHWRLLTLSEEFSSVHSKIRHENSPLQTSLCELRCHWGISILWHLKCRCSAQAHSLATPINVTCYEMILITAVRLASGTEASSARLPVVTLICTWSAHAEARTQRYTDKHVSIHLQKQLRRQNSNSSLA